MVQSSREQRDVRFGLVDHATANLIAARIVQELTPDTKRVLNAINRLDDAGGADNLPDGIDVAARMLQQSQRQNGNERVYAMIILSDGGQSFPARCV